MTNTVFVIFITEMIDLIWDLDHLFFKFTNINTLKRS